MQADARLVENIKHSHQARTDLRGETDSLRFAAGQCAGTSVEVQIVQSDSEEQVHSSANLVQNVAARIGAAPRGFDGAEEGLQLVEIQLADVVNTLARNGE